MPFSFGIPLGLLAIAVGSGLYLGTRQKKVALVIAGVGAAVALFTLAVIALVTSPGL